MYTACGTLNVHEYMRRKIVDENTTECKTPSGRGETSRDQNGQRYDQISNFDDIMIYFDSRYRDGTADISIGEIKWSIAPINNSRQIDNYVQITIGPFYFPKIYGDVGGPEFFYYQRAYLEITSAPASQAYLGSNNTKFHFEFEVENLNGNAVRLVPILPTFYFQRPVSTMADFSLRFMVPSLAPNATTLKRIPIPADTIPITMLLTGGIGYNPIRFQIQGGFDSSALAPVGVLSAPGLAVTIGGFQSADVGVNTQLSNQNGIYITNILTTTTFEIAGVDSSAINAQISASLYIPKNRFAIPIRFTSVRKTPTNYLTGVRY